jgi:hypothetical protein
MSDICSCSLFELVGTTEEQALGTWDSSKAVRCDRLPDARHAASMALVASLSPAHWSLIIAAGAVFLVILAVKFIARNTQRWRELSDVKLDVISEDFLSLRDLPRVRLQGARGTRRQCPGL